MRIAALAILEQRRPVGLLVWQGRHAWVMSGFESTGDPRSGDFRVTKAYILDPLHPYGSSAWGPSPDPGTATPVKAVGRQFVPRRTHSPWNLLPGMAALSGKYVLVIPTDTKVTFSAAGSERPPRPGPGRASQGDPRARARRTPAPAAPPSLPRPRNSCTRSGCGRFDSRWSRVTGGSTPTPDLASRPRSELLHMKTTRALRELGQSLWLDNITRPLLDSGTLQRYIDELDVTGLTSNPTIFDKAIGGSDVYDDQIAESARAGKSHEDTFFELAIADLRRAADLFRPTYERTNGVDGYVSLEVSPLIAYDTATTTSEAKRLSALGDRPNLYIKIPGTPEGNPAIEASIFAGVPINVTLLFSPRQTLASAEAYTRGIERRLEAGLSPKVESVASLFVSRWDPLTADRLPADLQLQLGLAIGKQTYVEYTAFFASERWQRLDRAGRPPAAPAVREHRRQGPVGAARAVRAWGSPRRTRSTPSPRTRSTRSARSSCRSTRCRPRRPSSATCWPRSGRPASTSTRRPLELQTKGAEAFVKSWTSLLDRISGRVAAVV